MNINNTLAKIYVTHATSFDYQANLYQPLQNSNISSHYQLIFPHAVNNKPTDSKTIIQKADLLLAEVSYPSTGQGIELGWANLFNVPIICFHKDGNTYSPSLNILTTNIFSYKNSNDLIQQLEIFLLG